MNFLPYFRTNRRRKRGFILRGGARCWSGDLTCPQQPGTALSLSTGRTEPCSQVGLLPQQGWECLGHSMGRHKLQAGFLRWCWGLSIPATCTFMEKGRQSKPILLTFLWLFLFPLCLPNSDHWAWPKHQHLYLVVVQQFPGLIYSLLPPGQNRFPLHCLGSSMTKKGSTASLLTFGSFGFH